ncbi:prolyl 4-hydroxylase [Microcystis phage Mel-JY01]
MEPNSDNAVHTIFKVSEDAFTPDECANIIKLCKDKLHKMITMNEDSSGRIATGTWLYYQDNIPEIKKLCEIISIGGGKPIENQEGVNIVRYLPGGKYSPHYDFFEPDAEYFNAEMAKGGQRIQSWILYLNDNFSGGETEFIIEKQYIKPKTGALVGWNNTLRGGVVNRKSLHTGHTVRVGEKWVAIVWVRENSTQDNNK